MQKILTLLLMVAGIGCGIANSQNPQGQSDLERQKIIDRQQQERNRQSTLNREDILARTTPENSIPLQRKIVFGGGRYKNLLRKLTKENLEYLKPALADYKKYEGFLSQPKTGLIKLLPDIECGKLMVIDASSPCGMNATIPGDGAAYSFRKNNYEEVEISDLLFKNGKFQTEGLFTQGLLVNLGAVPIETVSLDSRGMKFLTDFVPAKHTKEILVQKAELKKGIKSAGFIYGNQQAALENTTYGLRSVAYRGTDFLDNRRDVIIVFQIIRLESDGSVVIVWKQLQNIQAPKMKR